MNYEIKMADALCKSPATPLAVKGFAELHEFGWTSDRTCSLLHPKNPVIWVEIGAEVAAVLVYSYEELDNSYWIWLAYVAKDHRKQGLYKHMYAELLKKAKEADVYEIAGAVSPHNGPMRKAAQSVDRVLKREIWIQRL